MSSAPVSITLLPHDEKTLHLRIVPYDLPTIKKIRSLLKVYGQGDLYDMLEGVHNPKHRLVLLLAYGCGLRLSETHAIKVNDIDWDRMVQRIHGKGPRERDLPLDESISSPLHEYITDNPKKTYLFEEINKGRQYSRRTIQKIYENACKNAGIQKKGDIHTLRQSYAIHLLEQGTGMRQIQALLGHANSKTTPIYTQVSQDELGKIKSPLASLKPRKKRGSS